MIDAIKSKRFALPFAGAFLLMTCLLAVPDLAWAGIAEDINAWICGCSGTVATGSSRAR